MYNTDKKKNLFTETLSEKSYKEILYNDKWKKRLLSLDENEQKQIASKYYGGHMPWKK
jgi:hypothetical protein